MNFKRIARGYETNNEIIPRTWIMIRKKKNGKYFTEFLTFQIWMIDYNSTGSEVSNCRKIMLHLCSYGTFLRKREELHF